MLQVWAGIVVVLVLVMFALVGIVAHRYRARLRKQEEATAAAIERAKKTEQARAVLADKWVAERHKADVVARVREILEPKETTPYVVGVDLAVTTGDTTATVPNTVAETVTKADVDAAVELALSCGEGTHIPDVTAPPKDLLSIPTATELYVQVWKNLWERREEESAIHWRFRKQGKNAAGEPRQPRWYALTTWNGRRYEAYVGKDVNLSKAINRLSAAVARKVARRNDLAE